MFIQVIAGGVLLQALMGMAYAAGILVIGVGIVAYELRGGMISVT